MRVILRIIGKRHENYTFLFGVDTGDEVLVDNRTLAMCR